MHTILVIEDNAVIRENTAEILEMTGYHVLTAQDGKEGLSMVNAHTPDLILCDIMMPEMDGYGVLYRLSMNPKTASIPFIFITAKTERADIRKGMEMGADDYLTKPFDDVELLKAVEGRLKKEQAIKPVRTGHTTEPAAALLRELVATARKRTYQTKQHVFLEGDEPLYLYYITKGRVKTYLETEDGREMTTALYSEEDFFGYEALLLNKPVVGNAAVMADTEVALIRKDAFLELLHQYPGMATTFLGLLSNAVANKDQQLVNLAYQSVRKRVAEAILLLAGQADSLQDGSKLKITRDDLAAIAGTASETISRNLSDFIEEGLITKEGNTIVLCSVKKLGAIKQ